MGTMVFQYHTLFHLAVLFSVTFSHVPMIPCVLMVARNSVWVLVQFNFTIVLGTDIYPVSNIPQTHTLLWQLSLRDLLENFPESWFCMDVQHNAEFLHHKTYSLAGLFCLEMGSQRRLAWSCYVVENDFGLIFMSPHSLVLEITDMRHHAWLIDYWRSDPRALCMLNKQSINRVTFPPRDILVLSSTKLHVLPIVHEGPHIVVCLPIT